VSQVNPSVNVTVPAARLSWRTLFQTDATWTPAVARIALGAVMLPHGLQKLMGWFGGYGFTNTLHYFTDTMHVPWILALAVIVTESFGALALIFGAATRLAAAGVGAVFVVAVATVHAPNGFFMNWAGNQKGEGIEYFILGLALVAIVLVRGAGRASIDGAFSSRPRS
jgi:putative oxidoreductase